MSQSIPRTEVSGNPERRRSVRVERIFTGVIDRLNEEGIQLSLSAVEQTVLLTYLQEAVEETASKMSGRDGEEVFSSLTIVTLAIRKVLNMKSALGWADNSKKYLEVEKIMNEFLIAASAADSVQDSKSGTRPSSERNGLPHVERRVALGVVAGALTALFGYASREGRQLAADDAASKTAAGYLKRRIPPAVEHMTPDAGQALDRWRRGRFLTVFYDQKLPANMLYRPKTGELQRIEFPTFEKDGVTDIEIFCPGEERNIVILRFLKNITPKDSAIGNEEYEQVLSVRAEQIFNDGQSHMRVAQDWSRTKESRAATK